MRQVTCARGISATDGTLLEMTLQDITSAKSVSAKYTHVRAVASVYTRLDHSLSGKFQLAYVGANDASNALRASKFLYNEGKEIFRLRL